MADEQKSLSPADLGLRSHRETEDWHFRHDTYSTEKSGVLLYDPALLERLDPSKFKGVYKNGVSPLSPGENLRIRPLCADDYEKGYLSLLSQLTSVGDVSKDEFLERFNKMKASDDTYYVTVIEDVNSGAVIGSASLVKEQKFIHNCAARARIEDVVVSDLYRGKQLGKVLIDVLVAMAPILNCYKISLECKDDLVKFYGLFGLEATPGENFMQRRFFD